MYHLMGFEQNLETFILLGRPYAAKKEKQDPSALKKAYFGFLKKIQPMVPQPGGGELEFINEPKMISKLVEFFTVDTALNDIENIMTPGSENYRKEALGRIQENYQILLTRNPQFCVLFKLVINMIFCAKSKMAGGGTTSVAIGVIWSDHRPQWQEQDFMEFFIHETAHTLLFLDEYRYQHYTHFKEILKQQNYSTSAILYKKRPLDKVMHSLVVAAEILLARAMWLGEPRSPKLHPPTSMIYAQTLRALDELQHSKLSEKLLSTRAQYLLECIRQKISLLNIPNQTAMKVHQYHVV